MGRLMRIAIYAFIILILYFWVTAIMKSYQKSKSEAVMETPALLDTLASDSLVITEADTTETEKLIRNEDIVSNTIDYNEVDSKVKELEQKASKEAEVVKTKDKVSKPTVSSQNPPSTAPRPVSQENKNNKIANTGTIVKGDGGKYMVMAGSYLLKENAAKMVKKLKTLGYEQAEIVVFQSSQYHSVVAARFASEATAQNAAAALKRKGVDSFVKK
ncbi:MAG: SPOR domain-containing protein [Saprospiraceae bacterium]|nr:SPOR domain-containing protein [Saprospiraceae bacterium]MBK8669622.1 SPOR domain-containing protein [Saprospiraceae bacterium]